MEENNIENKLKFPRIFLSSPHMSAEGYEKQFIQSAFDKNFIAPLGENVDKMEMEFIEMLEGTSAAALITGTAAIHMALKAINVGEGDIVFCQSLTFSATANPIIYQNAKPVFIDSDFETWNMSPIALESAFVKYTKMGIKPKAVIIVHLYGLAADIDPILEICKKYEVPLIEDAAESLGTTYKGKYTGTFGTAGIFSFNGNKIITTSGGGMLVWNNYFAGSSPAEIIQKVKFWATQSREPARHYQHNEIGYNYRMSNILAGIGRGQLKVLDLRIKQKQHIYEYYKKSLAELDWIEMMPVHEWEKSNCWLSAIQLKNISPIEIIEALEAVNAEARPIWKPLHMQPVFQEFDYIDNGGVGEQIFNNGVCLPSDSKMTDEDLERVCMVIKKIGARNA